jgi:cysteinylglycine-S-conjugate dipeptidase
MSQTEEQFNAGDSLVTTLNTPSPYNYNAASHNHSSTCGCLNEFGKPIFVSSPSAATQKAIEACEKNLEKHLEELSRLVKIPSVSLIGFPEQEMLNSANATAELLEASGLENVKTVQFGNVHPYVYGEWIHKPNAPTLLLYAHHDVQPPGRNQLWKSSPFQPTVSGGRLFGRGTADDKAGILAHTAAIASFLKTSGELPVNVKIIIEGEEEIGSAHLAEFTRRHREMLRADAMVLTDCANLDSGIPSITTALRGLVAVDLEIETLSHPVHSGLWGGILPDPVVVLAQVIAKTVNSDGTTLIPDFEKDVQPLTVTERTQYENMRMQSVARAATGLRKELNFVTAEAQFAERLWRRPHTSVNAIQSGSRSLVSNIIQDGAWARISVRIVPNMTPERVYEMIKNHVEKVCPEGFKINVKPESIGNWWSIKNPEDEVYKIASRSLEMGYGRSTQFIGCGASIPFVAPLSAELGDIPAILVGVEDPYTNAHSENESLNLDDFKKTLFGQIFMLAEMQKWQRA